MQAVHMCRPVAKAISRSWIWIFAPVKMSMLPAWITAARCPGRGLDLAITAPLQPVGAPNDDVLQWYGEVRSPLGLLRELWRENCRVDAFMRFARAPWLSRIVDKWVVGDLRYDREAELGFAELEIESEAERCPNVLPPWVSPREELRQAPKARQRL